MIGGVLYITKKYLLAGVSMRASVPTGGRMSDVVIAAISKV